LIVFGDGPAEFVFGGVVRLGMAAVFAQSGVQALRDRVAYVEAVRAYGLLPDAVVPVAAAGLTAANLAIAALLLPAATAASAAAAGCVVLLLYAGAMRINLWRGRTDIECGCGGPGQKISAWLVSRNLILAGLLARASLWPTGGGTDEMTVIALYGGAVSFAALYFAASQLLANKAALAGTRA
jgi:hypothetical protein